MSIPNRQWRTIPKAINVTAMFCSDRLAALMEQNGISQSELSRRIGATQSTIWKLLNEPKQGFKNIHILARELHTTPSYLMGETDDPLSDSTEETLTSEEREWIELLRGIRPNDRKAALQIVRSLATMHHRPEGGDQP